MNFEIPADIQAELVRTRTLGRELFRPAGLEADRQGGPLATDHPLFRHMLALGFGRTSWRPDGQAPHKRSAVAHVLVSEELAYWDRGISIAMPGPGLGEPGADLVGAERHEHRAGVHCGTERGNRSGHGAGDAGGKRGAVRGADGAGEGLVADEGDRFDPGDGHRRGGQGRGGGARGVPPAGGEPGEGQEQQGGAEGHAGILRHGACRPSG